MAAHNGRKEGDDAHHQHSTYKGGDEDSQETADGIATGAVYIDGKTWTARSDNGSVIEPGEMVRILRMEGVKLYVGKEC